MRRIPRWVSANQNKLVYACMALLVIVFVASVGYQIREANKERHRLCVGLDAERRVLRSIISEPTTPRGRADTRHLLAAIGFSKPQIKAVIDATEKSAKKSLRRVPAIDCTHT